MESNARRYNLDVSSLISHGIGSTGTSYQCSILQAFVVDCGTTTVSYPAITTEDLQYMPQVQFNRRISDYLDYINIESEFIKEAIITGATFFDPDCEFVCQLNPEFLVYRFLDGVRVVDIGSVYGTAEYKMYQVGEDPESVSWQTNGTFLGINLNYTYVFEVRDFWNGEEFCKVSRTVSIPTLVQSTTFTAQPKNVYLLEVACGGSGSLNFNVGRVCVVPTLVDDEKVQVNFTLAAETIGDGYSCAQLTCKPNGCAVFINHCCVTDSGVSPRTGSFTICAGDSMCFTIQAQSPTAGSWS